MIYHVPDKTEIANIQLRYYPAIMRILHNNNGIHLVALTNEDISQQTWRTSGHLPDSSPMFEVPVGSKKCRASVWMNITMYMDL